VRTLHTADLETPDSCLGRNNQSGGDGDKVHDDDDDDDDDDNFTTTTIISTVLYSDLDLVGCEVV
jgi:hypothetical protein